MNITLVMTQVGQPEADGVAKTLSAAADVMRAAANNPFGVLALAILAIVAWAYAVREKGGTKPDEPGSKSALPVHVVGLVAILAVVLVALQMYFRDTDLKARDTQITDLQRGLKETETRLAEPYDITFKLLFPEGRPRNPFRSPVEVFLQRTGEAAPRRLESDRFRETRGQGGINVEIPHLRPGDKVYITVREEQELWRSDDIRLPDAQLKMNPSS
jgi:hypothetical protein